MTDMLTGLIDETNVAFTENGARVFATTKSSMLDFFALGGALRNRAHPEVISLFDKALAEDPLMAVKAMFYFRDVRGGQGERDTFRVLIQHMASVAPDTLRKNLVYIPYFGRWDDLYALVGTSVEDDVFALIGKQFTEDRLSETPSLMGKWLKSENASSDETKKLGYITRKALGLSSKEYRLVLSDLRRKVNVVERLISANKWDNIDYSSLPSNAGLLYSKAFGRHDGERYKAFIDAVNAGEQTINAKTLFPYELVRKAMQKQYDDEPADPVLDAMWNNLPNYMGDTPENSIAVVDVSFSMSGLPMEVAVSLGMYIAERSKGPYKDYFITFSESPQMQKVEGTNFVQKVANLVDSDWGMNTDIEAVFDLILQVAVKNKLSQDDMVERLYIISDMEFDDADSRASNESLFDVIADKYKQAGYIVPKLVFWNVDSRNDQTPITTDHRGVQLVSGCSPFIFTSLMMHKDVSAYDLMVEVLNSERYAAISV